MIADFLVLGKNVSKAVKVRSNTIEKSALAALRYVKQKTRQPCNIVIRLPGNRFREELKQATILDVFNTLPGTELQMFKYDEAAQQYAVMNIAAELVAMGEVVQYTITEKGREYLKGADHDDNQR